MSMKNSLSLALPSSFSTRLYTLRNPFSAKFNCWNGPTTSFVSPCVFTTPTLPDANRTHLKAPLVSSTFSIHSSIIYRFICILSILSLLILSEKKPFPRQAIIMIAFRIIRVFRVKTINNQQPVISNQSSVIITHSSFSIPNDKP